MKSYRVTSQHRILAVAGFALMLIAVYPSDLSSYGNCDRNTKYACPQSIIDSVPTPIVTGTEYYLRFVNTAAQVALPLVLRDTTGLMQLLLVGLGTTVATHGLKRALDQRRSAGARLGQRPWGSQSKHNMPSGHSSMASCATVFVARRYGTRHLWYLLPILLMTMLARVALNEHTISAVLAGTLLGLITTLPFTTRFRTDRHRNNEQ